MTALWVTIAIVLDGAIALIGGLVPDRWLEQYRAPMLGFAAGTLLASGLGDILPEAIDRGGVSILGWTLAALIGLGAFERVTARRARHRDRPIVPAALLGSDALHNLGDGIAIAAAFLTSTRLGLVTSAAVMVHELPEEIADYALIRSAGMSKTRALATLATVQLTAAIGAAATLAAWSFVDRAEGVVLAVAGGMFVYIGACDLLPELWRMRSRTALAAGVLGAALVIALS